MSARLAFALLVLVSANLAASASASAATLYVNIAHAACDDSRTPAMNSASSPWCTLTPAASQATAGDGVLVYPGVYRGTFRPLVSGTAAAPIVVTAAAAGVTLDAAGAAQAVKLISVSYWTFDGVTVRGGANQGVWADLTHDITLNRVTVTANAGAGVQLKNATGTRLTNSTVSANISAGVLEHAGSTGTQLTGNVIASNGLGGAVYNGDGVQLAGAGTQVTDNTITGNGDRGPYEHGIYTAATATGFVIERNTITDSGGANIKAAGVGTVRYNRLTGGTYGLTLASNPQPVDVVENVLTGAAQHLVFLTAGSRGRLYHNTVRQTGRSTASGDASAVFVNDTSGLEMRNNLACYDNADNLGVGFWVNNAVAAGTLVADTNWFCSRDPGGRHVAWAGTRTATAAYQQKSDVDRRSVFSTAPTFDEACRPVSPLLGAGAGDFLSAVSSDFGGRAWPAAGPRDIGAYALS